MSVNEIQNDFQSLFSIFNDDSISIDSKISTLTKFKGHVKKELVNIPLIPSFFDTLLLIPEKYSNLINLITLSHSSLCYLIKRVAVQSPSNFDRITVGRLINHLINNLPNIISKLNNTNGNLEKKFWLLSIKALETIYLVTPLFLEDYLQKLLVDYQNNIKLILLTIDELIKINLKNNKNPIFTLQIFIPFFIKLLNNPQQDPQSHLIAELISDILKKYLNEQSIMDFINQLTKNDIKTIVTQNCMISSSSTSNTTNNQHSSQGINDIDITETSSNQIFDKDYELNIILNDSQSPQSSTISNPNNKLHPHPHNNNYYNSMDQLHSDLNNLLIPFQGIKETEQNWKQRQSNIIEMRSKIFHIDNKIFQDDANLSQLINILRDTNFLDCISKTILSLRTTLSLNSCQLLKDIIILCNDKLSLQMIDQIFIILKNLLSSTKKISSQMSFHCLIIMLIHIESFHNKLFSNCFSLINEKNVFPRICSATLLRIILIKFNIQSSKLENNLIYIEEWLKKGISDAQTIVREPMRVTFWYYYKCYPNNAKDLLNSAFSAQLKKSIELSIPNHLHLDYSKISQNQRNVSSHFNSINGSRRSSINHNNRNKNFPSYAKPTQASKSSSLNTNNNQRNSKIRSTSEFLLREHNNNSSNSNSNNIHNSDLHTSLKDQNGNSNLKRKVSAPPMSLTNNGSVAKKRHLSNPYSAEKDFELHREDPNHLDLTDEVSNNHSNTLIKKYLNEEKEDSNNTNTINMRDDEIIYEKLQNLSTTKNAIEILQNTLLDEKKDILFNFDKILPSLRNAMLKNPFQLKNLLTIARFINVFPLNYIIELYSINNLESSDLFNKLTHLESKKDYNDLITITLTEFNNITSTFNLTNRESPEISIFYLKYRSKIFNFSFKFISLLFETIKENEKSFTTDNDIIGKLLSKLFQLYGQEFDSSLYFELLYKIYLNSREIFKEILANYDLFSTKLKIFNELKLKDINFFDINEIMKLDEIPNTTEQDYNDIDEKEDDTNVKRYMEMTMVNPFQKSQSNATDKRTPSTSSVIHNSPTGEDEKDVDDNSNDENVQQHTENNNRLYEMTKIVSVYQTANNIRLSETETETVDLDNDKDISLSDIFNKNEKGDENEHTVKFSTDPPKIINTVDEKKSNVEGSFHREILTEQDPNVCPTPTVIESVAERKKSTLSSSSKKDSTKKAIAFEKVNIGQHDMPSLGMNSQEKMEFSHLGQEMQENALVSPIKIISNESTFKLENSLLNQFVPDSLIHYEVADTISHPTNDFNDFQYYFKHMLKSINRIKSGSFTMKHLNYLIEPLISFGHDQQLKNWLDKENGYNELLDLCCMLLQSTDETPSIPVRLGCKSMVLLFCLIKVSSNLENPQLIFSSKIADVWNEIVLLINNISDYNNEIYLLSQELRDELLVLGFFNSKSITRILSILVMEINEQNPGIKETFLMETLSRTLQTQYNSNNFLAFKKQQLTEIIQTMSYFTETTNTNWRYQSTKVLSYILRILKSSNHDETDIFQMFTCLEKKTFKLVNILSSQ
ncbi:hypothetical protein NCAS_0A10920 [Naumovozyma castellii]|uniref:Protein STU1 n=1 Tax=Naumovozyma castellii TaxID=27288 RepID=G0V852_NAUCA|nr:hypothetical protein NCAS_0A10920 [Naumovozyma castellii CBS 4309]CCC67650.1 hypothetical protein NCAS_0A10920 [Naumovozyma castellii CBS 4309]